MKQRLLPWVIALLCAIALHIAILGFLDSQNWFKSRPQKANFEVTLLKSKDTLDQPKDEQTPKTNVDQGVVNKEHTHTTDLDQGIINKEQEADEKKQAIDYSQKPSLLDLSKMKLSPEATNSSLDNIFSPVLKEKIIASKKAQAKYLKGQIKSIEYPITADADGTRYVNIKGVCWRIPKEGSNEKWAIVFAGCNGQTETFHFELKISPSLLLGSDSPFSLNQ